MSVYLFACRPNVCMSFCDRDSSRMDEPVKLKIETHLFIGTQTLTKVSKLKPNNYRGFLHFCKNGWNDFFGIFLTFHIFMGGFIPTIRNKLHLVWTTGKWAIAIDIFLTSYFPCSLHNGIISIDWKYVVLCMEFHVSVPHSIFLNVINEIETSKIVFGSSMFSHWRMCLWVCACLKSQKLHFSKTVF